MAYTRSWDDATPAGTRAAKEIDNAIREFKVDTNERLTSLLKTGTTINDDPLVLRDDISGAATGKKIMFGPTILQAQDDEDNISFNGSYMEMNAGGEACYGLIPMPVGYTITLFEAWADKAGAASVTVNLSAIDVTFGVPASLTGDLTRSVINFGVLTSGALAYTTEIDHYLQVKVTAASSLFRARIYGFRITYDRANSSLSY